jgi:hypothetical protein
MFVRHLDALKRHHVTILRVDVGWSASQPRNATPSMKNVYNRRIATVLDAAGRRGMKVLLTLHQSPNWARPGTGAYTMQYPADPRAIGPWATWLGRTFGGRVAAWEIWNEPNLVEFTGVGDPARRPARYVPLLRAAAEGLRAGDRNATVVFGAPAHVDDVFIRECYRLGAKPYFDVMAVHPYQGNQTKPPESRDIKHKARMTHFPALVATMEAYGDAGKPVWWTEFGFSVHSNENMDPRKMWLFGVRDVRTSGEYLRRAFELARVRYPQVRVAIVYAAYGPPGDAYGHKHGYRLLETSGRPLLQLEMLASYMAGFGGHRPLVG